jgi:hypothetical protein
MKLKKLVYLLWYSIYSSSIIVVLAKLEQISTSRIPHPLNYELYDKCLLYLEYLRGKKEGLCINFQEYENDYYIKQLEKLHNIMNNGNKI